MNASLCTSFYYKPSIGLIVKKNLSANSPLSDTRIIKYGSTECHQKKGSPAVAKLAELWCNGPHATLLNECELRLAW